MPRHHQKKSSAPGGSQRQLRVGEQVRHAMAEILQWTLNPRGALARVLRGHADHQTADLCVDGGRPEGPSGTSAGGRSVRDTSAVERDTVPRPDARGAAWAKSGIARRRRQVSQFVQDARERRSLG